MNNQKRNDKIKRIFLYGVGYCITTLLVVSFSKNESKIGESEGGLDSVFFIVFIALLLPMALFGYYNYRKFLNKKGIKTRHQIDKDENEDDVDVFIGEIKYGAGAISTNIFSGIKNKWLSAFLNFFGDVFVTLIFLIYVLIIGAFSAFLAWSLINLFNKVF